MFSRKSSPVVMCARPTSLFRRAAWVPLPAPGRPSNTTYTVPGLPDEAFVLAHHQLRLDLAHRVQDDANHDDQAATRDAKCSCAPGPAEATGANDMREEKRNDSDAS